MGLVRHALNDIDSDSHWTLAVYRREGCDMMDAGRIRAMTVSEENLVTCDQNNSQRYTALGAWKQCWAVLRKWCVGILIDDVLCIYRLYDVS